LTQQLVLIALVAVAAAAPAKLDEDKPIEIISSNSEMNADGSYSFE
jgi:hypothetical protein